MVTSHTVLPFATVFELNRPDQFTPNFDPFTGYRVLTISLGVFQWACT